jgi:hypothetical protein
MGDLPSKLSPRAIRERVTRTPRTSPLASPATPLDSPLAPDPGGTHESDDPEFAKFCQNFRTSTVPRMQELAARRRASTSTTIAVPLDPLNEIETPPHNNLTALDAHRLRESIACKLTPDETCEPFWQMATRVV